MNDTNNHHPPGFGILARRLASTGLGLLHNRAELLVIEWQQEKAREIEMVFGAMSVVFLCVMGALLLTTFFILLFPVELRIYATVGFSVLYFAAAAGAAIWLKSLFKRPAFPETLDQVKKDRLWLESLK